MPQSRGKSPAVGLDPLDRVGWLASQPPEFVRWVAENGRWRRFAAGEAIYLAGDEPDGMYGLAAGALEINFPLRGEEPVTIHRAEPGFWIGEAAMMAGATRLVGLSAALDSRVFHIPTAPLRDLLQREPGYWRILYEQSFANLTIAVTLIAEGLALSPRARIARLLLRLADADGRVTANQEDLGRLIGMTRSSVGRSLASLVESGIVRTGYRCLEIVDPDRLTLLSSEA
jgi:CRP-like cAMP-binding protein